MSILSIFLLVLTICSLAASSLAQAAPARATPKQSFLRQPPASAPSVHWLPASAPPAWNTSGWFGVAYTPAPAGNQLWWYEYEQYEPLVREELHAASTIFGFNTLRTFIHTLVHANDSQRFIRNIDRYLAIADGFGIKAGFTFFDDCWSTAGATLPDSCVPVKGRHNGCWKTSPQEVDRTDIERYKPYVTEIISAFRNDSRVLFWEIFNEPNSSNFTQTLRDAGYGWAMALQPTQPVISCWGDNPDTQIVDEHRYDQNFAAWTSDIYANVQKGGVVTEGGSRWYQGYDTDAGSTKLVMTWLYALRAAYGRGDVPFVPGMIVSWELSVGNSHTRWHWSTPDNASEPTIPWDAHLHWDHTPVSYTEAGLIQQYTKGTAPFLCLSTYMPDSYNFTADNYTTIGAKQPRTPLCELADDEAIGDAIYELSFWPHEKYLVRLLTHASGSGNSSSGYYVELVSLASNTLLLSRLYNGYPTIVSRFNYSTLESGVVTDGWNLLRVVVSNGSVEVYLNPTASEAMAGGILPRLSWTDSDPLPPGKVLLSDNGGELRVDYFSATKLDAFGQYVRLPQARAEKERSQQQQTVTAREWTSAD